MPTRANRDTNSYGMKVGNGAQAPHTEIEDRICLNIWVCVEVFLFLLIGFAWRRVSKGCGFLVALLS